MPQPTCVLDASAIIAWFRGEPGDALVHAAISKVAALSTVNWAESLFKLADLGIDQNKAALEMERSGVLGSLLQIRSFDEAQAREVARLRARTRSAGLSLGDRACIALGLALAVPVLTADRSWKALGLGVQIRLIR